MAELDPRILLRDQTIHHFVIKTLIIVFVIESKLFVFIETDISLGSERNSIIKRVPFRVFTSSCTLHALSHDTNLVSVLRGAIQFDVVHIWDHIISSIGS
jgi:hypothetical protein